ncbi:MAG: hypothetical protein JO130_07995 [Solirubrobacterales bacterium]|nr:hypothetical protein [Solirubrobacterales bacterium]
MAKSSQVRKGKPPLPERGAKAAAKTAKAVTKSDSNLPVPNGIARMVAKKAAKTVMRKTAEMGAGAVRRATDRAAVAGRSAYEAGTSRLVPIQLSIDVAVPIHVAWEEWRSYGCLPEGVHRIVDVERDGDSLVGHTAGPREVEWEAEIKDEREDESFAWRSVEGTDVAGLATFHQLSERLTRIELDLDVVPTNPSEAVTLALHVAHRRAEADLRRFKAHVEFISPDAYEDNKHSNGTGNGNGNGNRRRGKRSARSEQ